MKRCKVKFVATLIALLIAITSVPVLAKTGSPVYPVYPTREQNVEPYDKNITKEILLFDTWDNGRCSIKRVNPNATSVTISRVNIANGTINGKKTDTKVNYNVSRVKRGAFAYSPKVKTVTFGSGMRQFDYKSFTGATSLRKIIMSVKSLGKIDPGAFKGLNTSKIYVYVPQSLEVGSPELTAIKLKLKEAGIWASHVRRSKYA